MHQSCGCCGWFISAARATSTTTIAMLAAVITVEGEQNVCVIVIVSIVIALVGVHAGAGVSPFISVLLSIRTGIGPSTAILNGIGTEVGVFIVHVGIVVALVLACSSFDSLVFILGLLYSFALC